jgi:hypothetical protein
MSTGGKLVRLYDPQKTFQEFVESLTLETLSELRPDITKPILDSIELRLRLDRLLVDFTTLKAAYGILHDELEKFIAQREHFQKLTTENQTLKQEIRKYEDKETDNHGIEEHHPGTVG